MAGLMYNYTHIDYATDLNGDLVYLMHGLGKVKLWQGSAGVGYAYNWVPARGLLTYNFGRYFISAYGQFNNIRYRHQSTHGYLNDWFINTAIGIRL